jgi:hypothetical protein
VECLGFSVARKYNIGDVPKAFLNIEMNALGVVPMFQHASEYRRVNRALLGSSAEAVVRRRIHSVLAGIVSRELKAALQNRKRAGIPVPAELLAHFIVSTYISVLTWWLNSKNPVPATEIDVAYRRLVLPSLSSIFA